MSTFLIQKSIEYSLYALAFTITLQTRLFLRLGEINGGYSEYGTISMYAVDILIIFILIIQLILFALSLPRRRESRNNNENMDSSGLNRRDDTKRVFCRLWSWMPYLVMVLFFSVQIISSADKLLSFYKMSSVAAVALLFYVMHKAKIDNRKLIGFFLAGIALQAMLGFWQFTTQASFANKWLGLAEHKPWEQGTSVIETEHVNSSLFPNSQFPIPNSPFRFLRAYGGLDHPNIFGGAMGIGLIIIFIIFKQKIQTDVKRLSGLIMLLLAALFMFGLIVSFSRSAWIAASLGLVALLAVNRQSFRLGRKNPFLAPLLTVGLVAVLMLAVYPDLFLVRTAGSSRLETKSLAERRTMNDEAWGIIKKHPWFGVGLGNYPSVIAKEITLNQPAWYYQPVHNVLILVLAEIGFVGWLILAYCTWCLRVVIFSPDVLSLTLFFAAISLLDHWPWSMHFGALFMFFALGLAIRSADSCWQEASVVK